MVGPAFVLSCEAKIHQFDIFLRVEQDVLKLQITMNARVVVDVRDSTDKLSKDLLNLGNG